MVSRQLLESGPGTSATGFLSDLYVVLDDALARAAGTLGSTAGMGGRVTAFTSPYDALAGHAFTAACDLAGAVARLRLMVTATFDNYVRAEHAADLEMPGGHLRRPAGPAPTPYPFVESLPSAAGNNGGEPWIWHIVTALHPGAQWPDVRTGAVRGAADSWAGLGSAFGQGASYLRCAVAELDAYRAPEIPLACEILERLGRELSRYADQCAGLGTTLLHVADAADSARSAMEAACHHAELAAEAGTGVAVVAAALTLGVGGVGAEGALNAVLAGSIGLTIADLAADFLATVAALCESFQVMMPVVEANTLVASGILEARTVRASFESMDESVTLGADLGATTRAPFQMTAEELERLEETTNTHVVSKHVGRALQQLAARFEGRHKPPFSSTFPDLNTATMCINEALRTEEARVIHWLRRPERVLVLSGNARERIGIVMDPDGAVTASARYRIVLVKDRSMPDGFRVDSAYPIH